MRNKLNLIVIVTALGLTQMGFIQDKPVKIPASELTKEEQICTVCDIDGQGHGKEKVAAGIRYKGQNYYFCSKKEAEQFLKDPEMYVPIAVPQKMFAFDRADLNGKTWNQESFKNKVILVDFWATWCAPCKKNKPIEVKIQTKFGGDKFTILAVSIDEKEKTVRDYLVKHKVNFPVINDFEKTWADWNVKVVPSLFLVKNGEIIKVYRGEIKQTIVEADIAAALK